MREASRGQISARFAKSGSGPLTLNVTGTQIQYTQTVNLNFAGLSWPHVSVATLAPADPITIPDSAWPAS